MTNTAEADGILLAMVPGPLVVRIPSVAQAEVERSVLSMTSPEVCRKVTACTDY
jgi:hypothetical protein